MLGNVCKKFVSRFIDEHGNADREILSVVIEEDEKDRERSLDILN
ncbi:12023_t:CDS:2 [Dentiscutata erythropus]|uniref:12023_t:CDS:1 n=1 Tax=Dentiscutata erythropus TaxID=1348616 RepID=A0A9N8VFK5_9GLOM|nr:12023_t:CDS:2 [Dentiscutata erythropus]